MKRAICLFKNMFSHISVVKQRLDQVLHFLETHLAFANCHMVDYFTGNLYGNRIPSEIQNEISALGFKETLNVILSNDTVSCPLHLQNFIRHTNNCALHNLKDICMNKEDLENLLFEMGGNCVPSLNLKVFASPKKSHEVEVLSSIVAMLKLICRSTHVVDIGDGKGYLSSMLALHHSIPVLGIDSSAINTRSANKRAGKLQKAWKNMLKYPNKSVPPNSDSHITDNQLYKQTTMYVDENANLKELVCNTFMENCDGCSLMGLHTCGDLSPTSLKIYNKHSYIKSICNVGCCYHLLTEIQENEASYGFPLSEHLQTRNFMVGRQARMLASQSIDRILANKSVDNKIVFYRAVYQVLLLKYQPHLAGKHIGRLKKDCNSFLEYVRFASKRINAEFNVSDDEICEVYREYENREIELNIFYLLRSFLAQVVECVILLDRLLFLLERGHTCSYLVQFFDRVLSPRCYGIISIKNRFVD